MKPINKRQNDNLLSKTGKGHAPTGAGRVSNVVNDDDVISYLSTSRRKVIEKIVARGISEDELKPILKREIKKLVLSQGHGKDVWAIKFSDGFYKLISNFKLKTFLEKSWAYRPQFLKQKDYQLLQDEIKIPLNFEDIKSDQPVCNFPDGFETDCQCEFEKEFKQPQFFINEKDSMMFAKLTRLKYTPMRIKYARLLDEQGEKLELEDKRIFDRIISISFFAVPDGKMHNAIQLYRYDSSKLAHRNMFIGEDYRQDVFGQEVKSPHFHFQNEDDSLLCLKRQSDRPEAEAYKSGRCNAIDCEGLKKYLIDLDQTADEVVENLYAFKIHYGMPFLKKRKEKIVARCNFIESVNKFIKTLSAEDRILLTDVQGWISESQYPVCDDEGNMFDYDDYPCFGQLIRGLDFIQFVFDKRNEEFDVRKSQLLTKLEILCANCVMDAFAGVENLKELMREGYNPHRGLKAIDPEEKE